jgi:hypothetical protein
VKKLCSTVQLRTGWSGNRTGLHHRRTQIMATTILRTITLETVANYRQVAEPVVGAYRASGHRLLAMVNRNLDRGTNRIMPQLTEALHQTSAKASEAAAKGIDTVSTQTEHAIEPGATRVNARIHRVADMVQGIENRYVATGLEKVARISLTRAQAALTASEKLAADVIAKAKKAAAAVWLGTVVGKSRQTRLPVGPGAPRALGPLLSCSHGWCVWRGRSLRACAAPLQQVQD